MSSCQEKVEALLYSLGQPTLARIIGSDRLGRINKSGYSINTQLMSEILYSESGLNVFSNKDIRRELILIDTDRIRSVSDTSVQEVSQSIYEFNNFTWGNNPRSRGFLELLGLEDFEITYKKKSIKPIEDTNITKCLYSYQNWVRKEINSFLIGKKKQKAIVQMPTGAGKTRTMIEAVCDHIRLNEDSKITIVWLAHSEELCEQGASSFKDSWSKLGSESAQIIRLWGGASPQNLNISKPTFVVTSFQTAYQMIKTQSNQRFQIFAEIKRNCSLLIVDEAHQSIAPTYNDAISLFANRTTKIVGLTATPGRHGVGGDDEETIKLAEFYQHNHINIVDDNGEELEDPVAYLTDKGVLARINEYSLESNVEIEFSNREIQKMEQLLDIPKSVLLTLGADVSRNNMIATAAIRESIEKDFPTIVFAPSKDSAIDIALSIRLSGGSARAIVGTTPSSDRAQSIRDFKDGNLKVLVNFGVLTTGFDAPNIKAVIIARPTTSIVLYSQMLGRGLRGPLMGGEDECDIIDIQDNIINMPSSNQAYMFFKEYFS